MEELTYKLKNLLLKNSTSYLIQYDVNVIIVGWEFGSKKWWYGTSRDEVPLVGQTVAFMIDEIHSKMQIPLENIHIVGHSLGAHVAGIAGLMTKTGKVARVTGLDPAGPFFSYNDFFRISQKSAKFVDIMHTAGYTVGFHGPLGHVDFYPNGGYPIQPGCGFDFTTLKSHRRAYWLFAESVITPAGFLAKSCNSWSEFKDNSCSSNGSIEEMGHHTSERARGIYYLTTNKKTPFALGKESLLYKR